VSSELGPIEADVLLCDAAQEVGGKLFILGAGWSRALSQGPVTMALAIKLSLPWHTANHPMEILIALLTEDGRPVPDASGKPVQIEGNLEVGRPPGLRQGTHLDSSFAITVTALPLLPGHYRWELSIAKELLKTIPFEMIEIHSCHSPKLHLPHRPGQPLHTPASPGRRG